MKTKLKLKPHLINDQEVVELWWEGTFIGTITGADGPGIKIQSKYRRYVMWEDDLQTEIGIGELTVKMEDKPESPISELFREIDKAGLYDADPPKGD